MRSDLFLPFKATLFAIAAASFMIVSTGCGSVSKVSSSAVPVNATAAETASTASTTVVPEVTTLPPITLTTQQVNNAPTLTTALQPDTAPAVITNSPDTVRPPSQLANADGQSESTTIPQGLSMNSAFYQERLFVAGDSICHGFNVFGFVPEEHCLTQASVSMWNLDYFTFDVPSAGAYGLGLVDAIAAAKPKLLYMSLGMNDVNMNDPNGFAEKYVTTAKQIIAKVPDINIVIAGITPIDANITDFTSNDTIRNFNSCLQNAINAENSRQIYYFDAYSVIADPATLSLRAGGTSGDGIHLSTECYTDFLNALYSFLDKTSVMAQIKAAE